MQDLLSGKKRVTNLLKEERPMILNNDNKYRGNLGNTLKLDEYSKVEKPLMEQLIGLGWNTARQ